MRRLIFGFILLSFAPFGTPVLKVWKYDSDILNPEHWVGGAPGHVCDGLDLRDALHSVLVLDSLKVKQMLLPNYTTIYLLDDTRIELDQEDTGDLNCVRLKDNFQAYDWVNPDAWTTPDVENNVAVPHTERVPCRHDDVAFPKGWKSSQCEMNSITAHYYTVRSFRFGKDLLTTSQLMHFEHDIPIFPFYMHLLIEVDSTPCEDPTGCFCGHIQYGVCDSVTEPERYECLNPILPLGFCTKICGASILINTTSKEFRDNFKIEKVRTALKGFSSQTHVSKIEELWVTHIQIIFAEEKFTGSSVDEAKEFYSRLLSDPSFGASEAFLMTSGAHFLEGGTGRAAIGIVLGTLCGVLLIFGIIFFVNSSHFDRLNLRNRPTFSTNPLSNLFARYQKMEGRDRAESVISLQKSFDNPMYGTSAPSTASTSSTTPESMEKTSKAEIHLKNPLYEIHSLNESVEEASEGGQLVDMTPLKEAQ